MAISGPPHHLHLPTPLRPGGRVYVPSIAGTVQRDVLEVGAERLRACGLDVVFDAEKLATEHPYLAAADSVRLGELKRAFTDPAIDAVICARGGYGSIRLLEDFDVEQAARSRRPFMGFSDNTTLHLALNRAGLVTFHGPVVTALGQPSASEAALNRAVALLSQSIPGPETIQGEPCFGGRAEGRLFGGNLSILSASLPIELCRLTSPAILLIEEVGEPLYRIDRMLTGLRLSNLLASASGIALGSFSKCGDGGRDGERRATEVAIECLRPLGKPIISGLPIGHRATDMAVPLGVPARIDGSQGTLEWQWTADA